ncbi:hypothetical protein MESS2_1010009 [Mesorhizobium metallidurans STM 2683]|uniref:Aminotransferase class I/classII large domain-containing protein n=1 Tax=Mesorhizobium metallidurans STM 2683 TaxID=1297569 RepID=M5EFW4_9HYPH|nr:PLP-dependent aminotransferase family protein [Mesorhizobium metallidurans]CCV03078.1 hypothetical protein MESS2_1010009 [Mesorhizobium metallidurans STM 2683]
MDKIPFADFGPEKAPDRAVSSDGVIRLALNHPPPVPGVFNPLVSQAVGDLLRKTPPAELMATHRWMGTEEDRRQGAAFVGRRLGASPSPERIVVTHSTQAAVHMLLPAIVGNGRLLAVEQMTYPPIRSFAARYGIPVVDVGTDENGLDPDSFEQICRHKRPAALYLLSTFQNPTTVTIPMDRRKEIANIARQYNVQLIEDDVYSLLASSPLPPISAFVPELSWYLLGTAKSLSAGLKLAFVMAPTKAEAERAFWPGVRATYWMASPMSAALMAELISTGKDLEILAAVKAELSIRQQMVAKGLRGYSLASDPGCLHVWIPLKDASGGDIAAAALERGVQVATSISYARNDWIPPEAIRIGIGNPESRPVLEDAISRIRQALSSCSPAS